MVGTEAEQGRACRLIAGRALAGRKERAPARVLAAWVRGGECEAAKRSWSASRPGEVGGHERVRAVGARWFVLLMTE